MNKWIQIIFGINIFFNLTNLFIFAGAWVGVSLTVVGGMILLLNFGYMFVERRTLAGLLRQPIVVCLIILLFVWPVLWAIGPMFHGYGLKREIILQLLFISLTLSTAVFVIRNSYATVRRLVILCFIVTVMGMLAQLLLPSLFYRVASSAALTGEVFSYGRIAGFYVNPNNAARFIILMYILIMMSPRSVSVPHMAFYALATAGAVLLTGSRSSLLIMMVVLLAVLGLRFAFPFLRSKFSVKPERLALALGAVLGMTILLVVATPIASKYVLENTEMGTKKNMAKRLEFFGSGYGGLYDNLQEEALGRWSTVEPYLDGFSESWFFGRGMAGYRVYRNENYIPLTPHNTIFALWLDFGVFYIVAGFGVIIYMVSSRRMREVEQHVGLFFSPILFICLMGVAFTFDSLFLQRAFYVVIGIVVALYCSPRGWFQYDSRSANQPQVGRRREMRRLR